MTFIHSRDWITSGHNLLQIGQGVRVVILELQGIIAFFQMMRQREGWR